MCVRVCVTFIERWRRVFVTGFVIPRNDSIDLSIFFLFFFFLFLRQATISMDMKKKGDAFNNDRWFRASWKIAPISSNHQQSFVSRSPSFNLPFAWNGYLILVGKKKPSFRFIVTFIFPRNTRLFERLFSKFSRTVRSFTFSRLSRSKIRLSYFGAWSSTTHGVWPKIKELYD